MVFPEIVPLFVNEKVPPPEPVPSPRKLRTVPDGPADIPPLFVKITPTLPDVVTLVSPETVPLLVNEKIPPPEPVPSPLKLKTGPVVPPDIDP